MIDFLRDLFGVAIYAVLVGIALLWLLILPLLALLVITGVLKFS